MNKIVYICIYVCLKVLLYVASDLAHIELTAHSFVSCTANLYLVQINLVSSNIGYHKIHNS